MHEEQKDRDKTEKGINFKRTFERKFMIVNSATLMKLLIATIFVTTFCKNIVIINENHILKIPERKNCVFDVRSQVTNAFESGRRI